MKTTFLIALFTICLFTSNAQTPVTSKFSNPFLNGFYKNPPLRDTLLIHRFSTTKPQRSKQQHVFKTDLLLSDSTNDIQKSFVPKITNPLADNFRIETSFKDSLLIDKFSTIRFQKNPQLGFITRDLLLRDTDKEIKLIYPSGERNNLE